MVQSDETPDRDFQSSDGDLDPTAVRPETPPPSSGRKSRFTPGTVLEERYRIVAPLGKGGMGEVYRAEDLKLGQQVALKFLPRTVSRNPADLARLYEEVRIGRQVSHPNVCRLYDIGEWDGNHFIAMEYIDGEDLASLIRRIGRLPHDKGIDLARDICAGLAAAHGLDVIHRDLKPANVMIDGRGNARITDFGLAALVEDLEGTSEVAGTPAYMAPEQLAGGPVTKKTDLYALGLILYEMFTGKRRFDGRSIGEIVSQHGATSSQTLSRDTMDLDGSMQRVILRCLENEPENRPASIHSVIAALPGGDPLQAAIDAGETPSPEMVAAAGESGELRPSVAWPLLLLALILLVSAAWFTTTGSLLNRIPMPLTDEQLEFRARQVAELMEPAAPAGDRHHYFSLSDDYFEWARENRAEDPWGGLDTVHTSPLKFRYRQSPRELRPRDLASSIGWNDPPFNTPGMVNIVLDPRGNLLHVAAVPLEKNESGHVAEGEVDWSELVELAGFDPASLEVTQPQWSPRVPTTERFAWNATFPTQPGIPLRIEAATWEGRPIWFEVFPPWQQPLTPHVAKQSLLARSANVVFVLLFASTLLLSAFLARRNVVRGRSDRKNAFRLAVAGLLVMTVAQVAGSDMLTSSFVVPAIVAIIIQQSIGFAAVLWLSYLALEPYLRRRWPHTLISSTRLLSGRVSDPRVGRDIFIGVLAGLLGKNWEAVLWYLSDASGFPMAPHAVDFDAVGSFASAISLLANQGVGAMWYPLFVALVLLLAHIVLRSRVAAVGFTIIAFALFGGFPEGNEWLIFGGMLVAASILVLTIVRWGLLAGAACILTLGVLYEAPLVMDPSSWLFPYTLLFLLPLVALIGAGFFLALGRQSLFAEAVLEDL